MSLPKNWSAIKRRWRNQNPPDANGFYECWICRQPVHMSAVSLDHVAPTSLYPEYAKNLSNLRPSHKFCNDQRTTPTYAKITRHVKRKASR